jgi:hypothetical protein
MWWVVASLVVLVVFTGITVLLNSRPTRCPSCKRVNVFRRTKTGRRWDKCDEEGELRRRSTEYVCGRCGSPYWIVWDDFEGCRVSLSSSDADPTGERQVDRTFDRE